MSSDSLHIVLCFLIAQSCTVYGDDKVVKSSLAFVIDSTGSMYDEIQQIKDATDEIFEIVRGSNVSQIENFIIVSFNDPTAELQVVTKDQNAFKRALESIELQGGDDCPEYALKGIELALEHSLPFSYLFVFTDASAKDYYRFEQIKSLAQKKQSQITFVLTGTCGTTFDEDYQVYQKLAKATSGQDFLIKKQDVGLIMRYVKETVKARGSMLLSRILPPGYNKTLTYSVHETIGDVLISVTGEKPQIGGVTDAGGSKPETSHLIESESVVLAKVIGAKVGEYKVEVGSGSETHVVITASVVVHDQLGYSTFKPS